MSVAAARSVLSTAESDAFTRQKKAQAAKRAEEKRIVQDTHAKTQDKTKSVKNLRVSHRRARKRSPPPPKLPHARIPTFANPPSFFVNGVDSRTAASVQCVFAC